MMWRVRTVLRPGSATMPKPLSPRSGKALPPKSPSERPGSGEAIKSYPANIESGGDDRDTVAASDKQHDSTQRAPVAGARNPRGDEARFVVRGHVPKAKRELSERSGVDSTLKTFRATFAQRTIDGGGEDRCGLPRDATRLDEDHGSLLRPDTG